MPQIAIGYSSYSRELGDMPEIKLVNMFVEESPTDEDQQILQSRPGLDSVYSWGAGPIHGIFYSPGTFNGDIFAVSGLNLYRQGTLIGPILGSGPVRWAASKTAIVVTRGSFVYSYNGTDLSSITMPDGGAVIDVAYTAGLFFLVSANKQTFYWNDINEDERTVESLSFASAELVPDDLKGVFTVLGQVVYPGQDSIETWFPSGDADLPLSRIDQRLYSVGIRDVACMTRLGDILLFVGSNGKAYRLSGELVPISNPGIEERIKASTACVTFGFTWSSHAFFCVRLDDTTLVYDLANGGNWCEFNTYQHGNWRPKCAINVGADVYFGDDDDGTIWAFGDSFADDGEPLEGYFTALLAIDGGSFSIDSLEVRGNTGDTDPLSGDDASPVLEMRYSRTRGKTWGNWRSASLGGQGEYRTRTMFRRLGMFDSPGFIAQFRVTDITPRRVSGVWINEKGGGRSR